MSQAKISLPLHLEDANEIIELPVRQFNLDSFHQVSKEEMPLMVNRRMERSYYSFDNPVDYFFLGTPVEKIQMSLDKDSVIVKLYFIVSPSDKLLPAALKRFGEEAVGWTATTPFSSPDDPVPYYHHWEIGEHFLNFKDLLIVRNGTFVRGEKVEISFQKSLRDYYTE
ncbi:hypothetical protein [Chitinophaga sp. S165]|uniref:hypothetical protein n=1 Tax=Chitinophaga sp. S165 TaxID=2135462 RepID=UPI0011B4B16C|nr:hypothetical protein [Chitinophaga sp. S165]